MSRAQVRKVKMPTGVDDNELSGMFNDILGADKVRIDIAYPRYCRIRDLVDKIIQKYTETLDSALLKRPELSLSAKSLTAYIARMRTGREIHFAMSLDSYVDWSAVSEEDHQKFTDMYRAMKTSPLIKEIIVTLGNLVTYKDNFSIPDNMNINFVRSIPGIEWSPFPFVFNFREVLCLQGVGANTKKFLTNMLHVIYTSSFAIWNETQSPDVDVKKFAEIMEMNIDRLKSIPELSRCHTAFKKIQQSIGLLENKFNVYYRDFISTKDSTIIMQNFIADVSKDTNADPALTREFRIIINYYRKQAASQTTNPQVKSLFEKVNATFKHMEEGIDTEKIRTATASPTTPAAASAAASAAAAAAASTAAAATNTTSSSGTITADEKSVDQLAHEINSLGKKN
jgi:hypothetical protein